MSCCASAAPRRVVFVGIDGAGKTTLLQRLRLGHVVTPLPTFGCLEIALTSAKLGRLLLVDLPGQNMLRPLWRHHFDGVAGIAFVLDAADSDERLAQATDELYMVLDTPELARVPLVVLANKQDLAGARGADTLHTQLVIAERAWKIVPCTATTGDGVQEALTWLLTDAASARVAPASAAAMTTPAPSSWGRRRLRSSFQERITASCHAGFSPLTTDPLETCLDHYPPAAAARDSTTTAGGPGAAVTELAKFDDVVDLEAPAAAGEGGSTAPARDKTLEADAMTAAAPRAPWRTSIGELSRKFKTDDAALDALGSAAARAFYEDQNATLASFEELEALRCAVLSAGSATAAAAGETDAATDAANGSAVAFAVNASLAANVAILLAKAAVVSLSGSLVMIASLIDSVLDLLSGATLVLTERLVAEEDA